MTRRDHFLNVSCLFLAAVFFLSLATKSHAVVLFQNDFEDDPAGTYSVQNLNSDWNSPNGETGVAEGRVSITDDANAFGEKSLVINYPAGESNDGKSQWKLELDQGYEELFLSYRLRFDGDFDFVRGGKLPGLAGGAANTGGNKPNGSDGWSGRMMWRTDGSGGSPTNRDTANIVQYLYHPDQPSTFGEDLRWDDTTPTNWKVFESDQWYHLQHRVVMNTPGEHDGIVQAWLDDELVLDMRDIRYRDIASLQIDTLLFSTFFGGSSEIWETTKDEQVYFDDFVVATEFIVTTPGDYNGDGTIDAADFSVWRDHLGETGSGLAADGDQSGTVDMADFELWQSNFGKTVPTSGLQAVAVPEPNSAPAAFLFLCMLLHSRGRRTIRR